MKVILISRRHGGSRSIELSRWSRALLSICCLGLPLGLAASGYLAGQESGARLAGAGSGEPLQDNLPPLAGAAATLASTAPQMQALTINLAELEARMTRLDALGQHLATIAALDDGEFDFSAPPALGGPAAGAAAVDFSSSGLGAELGRFEAYLSNREQQLQVLETLLTNRKRDQQAFLSGLPVKQGYTSSRFGWRTDPITGKRALHTGLDIVSKRGTEIFAAAAGVVTWSGSNAGLGNYVEISHGDALVTRYAHNRENLVQRGDVVRKGETIALMGSTGRSTGPHLHYEVYKHGRAVDPAIYVSRTQP